MKTLGIIFSFIVVIAALVGTFIALDLGSLIYQSKTASVRGSSNAEVQIESAASRIANYNKFFDLCAAVQAKEDAIDLLKANASMDDEKRDMAITANQTQRANLIAEYNAAASKDYTAARFKSSDLPFTLPRGPYDGETRTGCAG
jgi:hypothetical protein